ncbi:MAG: tyrosine-type recombinase/integrase [Pseudomonadota bacterium]
MIKRTGYASEMRLHDRAGRRLYINRAERARILRVADQSEPHIRALCLTLLFTGCRISEALELRLSSIQNSECSITFRTLKRRRADVFREVPVPEALLEALDQMCVRNEQPDAMLWCETDRITAYRWIKAIAEDANIIGRQACPKGLRHGFGIHAILCGVPLNLLQKWMGHASMTTTAIYANALGAEERQIASRMWDEKYPPH